MATISKRGAKWFAQVHVHGKRSSKSFTTKKQAEQWAAKEETELRSIVDGNSLVHTMQDVFDRYGEEVSPKKRGTKWELNRLAVLGRTFGKIKLTDIRREIIEAWMEERLEVVMTSTVNRDLNLLSNVLTHARRWRLMKHNPMDDIKRPSDPPPRERRISGEEIEQILIALGYEEESPVTTRDQRIAVAFLFALETAMRSGEILKIREENLVLDKRYVQLTADMTKTATRRAVPLSTRALELLDKLRPFEDPVFQLADDERDVHFRKAVRDRTLIDDLDFHDTRHEATWRLSKKFEVMELARVTGHKDLKMLLRYYNPTAEELAAKLD